MRFLIPAQLIHHGRLQEGGKILRCVRSNCQQLGLRQPFQGLASLIYRPCSVKAQGFISVSLFAHFPYRLTQAPTISNLGGKEASLATYSARSHCWGLDSKSNSSQRTESHCYATSWRAAAAARPHHHRPVQPGACF